MSAVVDWMIGFLVCVVILAFAVGCIAPKGDLLGEEDTHE